MKLQNPTTQKHKKGTFVRSLIAVALAEALVMGSAMAVGTDATNTPAATNYNIASSDEDTSIDSNQVTTDASSYTTPDQLLAMGTVQRSAVGVMDVSDPLIAIDGMRGINYASLNGADPASTSALAMGVNSNASGGNAVAFGLQAVAGSDSSVAMGNNVTTGAGTPYSVAVGSDANTTGTQAVALGAQVQANADNALAVGNNNTMALGESSIAQGNGARVRGGATNSIAIGTSANVAANTTNAMALGANTSVTANGGSTVNADGTISTPTYTVGGQQVHGVEGAVTQLDRRIDGMQGQIDGLQGQLNNTARGAYSGIAAATALTMIPGVDVGKTLSIGAGVANYKGYTAAALGGEARVSENWKVRAGVGLSSSGNTVGVGASFQW